MPLLESAVQSPAQIKEFLRTLQEGQAPAKFTREFLRDIGFTSSNHLAFIPLLKGLGFLSPDGVPTQRYREFLDSTRWNDVLADAVKEAYSDLFIIKSRPTRNDKKAIAGKYKSATNCSDIVADRMANTFLALLDVAGDDALYKNGVREADKQTPSENHNSIRILEPLALAEPALVKNLKERDSINFCYNIQIHLPPTKDIEVYNAIFKSLKEHIFD